MTSPFQQMNSKPSEHQRRSERITTTLPSWLRPGRWPLCFSRSRPWTFISLFASLLVGWALLNTEILGQNAFDPYPYVFLNLVLSMLAAVQAPIIMMSQNRQAARDRMTMIRDFEVNLKADAAISELNQRLDHLAWQVLADLDQIKRAQKIDPTAPTPPAAG